MCYFHHHGAVSCLVNLIVTSNLDPNRLTINFILIHASHVIIVNALLINDPTICFSSNEDGCQTH